MPQFVDKLAPTTVKFYRSKLRKLFLSLNEIEDEERENVEEQIATLEEQLGVSAKDISGPGRPRKVAN